MHVLLTYLLTPPSEKMDGRPTSGNALVWINVLLCIGPRLLYTWMGVRLRAGNLGHLGRLSLLSSAGR